MDATLISDDHPVTLTWNSTTTEEHTLTLPYGVLREELDRLRDRHARPRHPDLAGDLDLLEESWLGEHEDVGCLSEFDRMITGHDLPPVPELPTFTVTVIGEERHHGQPGSTYVVRAPDMDAAKTLVTEHLITTCEKDLDIDGEPCDPDVVVVEGPWETFDGAPAWPGNLPGRVWTDLRAETELLERPYRIGAVR